VKKNLENQPIFDEGMCRTFGVYFFGIGLPCIGLDVVDAVGAVFRHTLRSADASVDGQRQHYRRTELFCKIR